MPLNLELSWCELEGRNALRISGWTGTELQELQGLDAGGLTRRLALYTSESLESGGDLALMPFIAGRFQVSGDSVCFLPRFPFVAGMRYSLAVKLGMASAEDDGPSVWKYSVR